ncbi:DNA-directed RNA polymeras-like protein I 49 kDa polypeptide [Lindgomyces ingoldianus]|uniref:DNA-directed RNA polymeras-like protein I 49 kDa polypeptide n=1 Tax=Lindgomyces ingoldianus TaxID=673940 RepID=A0ACB6R4M7_9PLEO|nr:DNA-directed RNA polymeras-like protein I 49 kDa polypeptide [Lindgomyces ingoldianus]KAF2474101.1 DNA-directed RNA polymeras-like protein I 49 kDa polypeptide [Lindgomyces ingoldianus]
MAEKKRKRHDDRSERPSKKTTSVQLPSRVTVDLVRNSEPLGPVLASTPGLSFPSKISLKPYKYNRILPDQDSSSSYELLLQSSSHPRLDYTAREEKDGSSDSLLKDYIGVFDPATGKLQVVEVHKVTVRSTLRSETDELREEYERITAQKESMTARRHALATEFGSKKSKKAIAGITENAIARGRPGETNGTPGDDAVASVVLQAMSTSAMPTKEDLQSLVNDSKPRPKANLAAEYPSGVYSIDTIVGKELMGMIAVKDWVEAAESGNPVNVHSRFVAKRIVKLVKSKEIQKLKILRFILLCMDFNAALKTKGKGAKQVPFKDKLLPLMGEGVSPPVVDAIRRNFASENNDMTRWHIDNMMTHIAAASLIVDNFEVDVSDLREDLKLENKEIKQYFHEIGCRVVQPTETERAKLKISKAEAVNHFIAKLKIPLAFPKISSGKRKR